MTWDSSYTSRFTAASSDSPGSTKPASVEKRLLPQAVLFPKRARSCGSVINIITAGSVRGKCSEPSLGHTCTHPERVISVRVPHRGQYLLTLCQLAIAIAETKIPTSRSLSPAAISETPSQRISDGYRTANPTTSGPCNQGALVSESATSRMISTWSSSGSKNWLCWGAWLAERPKYTASSGRSPVGAVNTSSPLYIGADLPCSHNIRVFDRFQSVPNQWASSRRLVPRSTSSRARGR